MLKVDGFGRRVSSLGLCGSKASRTYRVHALDPDGVDRAVADDPLLVLVRLVRAPAQGLSVQSVGCGVWGVGFGVWGFWFGVWG